MAKSVCQRTGISQYYSVWIVLASLLLLPSRIPAQDQTTQRVDVLGDPLPEDAYFRFGCQRFMHPGSVSHLLMSKDQRTIYSASGDRIICWDADNGKKLNEWKITRHGQGISAASYGTRLMSRFPNGNIAIANNGSYLLLQPDEKGIQEIEVLKGASFRSVDVSPDGKLLALGGPKRLVVCDPDGIEKYSIANSPKEPMAQMNGNDRLTFGGDFSYARFLPSGKLLALVNSGATKTIQLIDAESGERVGEIPTSARIVRMDFSPDGKQIVTTERDNAARLYDVETSKQVWEFVIDFDGAAEAYTSDIAFRGDGEQIAVGAPIGADYRIRLLEPKFGVQVGSLLGSGWKPWCLCYTEDHSRLYASGWDSIVRRWDLSNNQQIELGGKALRATSVCTLSRNNQLMAFASDGGEIHVIDQASKRTLQKIKIEEDAKELGQLEFSPDASSIALGYSSPDHIELRIWNLETATETHQWKWEKGNDPHSGVEALAFSKDGERICICSFRQSRAYVLDLSSKEQICDVRHPMVYGMDITNDGTRIVTAGWDRKIREWETGSNELLVEHEVTGSAGGAGARRATDTRMYGVKYSPDENFIATADMTMNMRVFDREFNEIRTCNTEGSFTFGALNYSNNGLWLASGTARSGSRITIFDVATGKAIWQKDNAHQDYIYTVCFSGDDQAIVSGSGDGVNYVWKIAPELIKADPTGDIDELVKSLRGDDGEAAFQAYHLLFESGQAGCEAIVNDLLELGSIDVADGDIRKWATALKSDQSSRVETAKQKLLEFGPNGYYEVVDLTKSDEISEEIKQELSEIAAQILMQTRRSTMLLAEIDPEVSMEPLSQLLKMSRSKLIKKLAFEAKRYQK